MLRTKPECLTQSASYVETLRLQIRFDDRQRIGLVFWVERHRSSTLDRASRRERLRIYRGTAREARRLGTKPECALESVTKEAWYAFLLRIRIDDRLRRYRRPVTAPEAAKFVPRPKPTL
jgi:hypothetical protein